MKEVTEIIENLQARLKSAGGGRIVITDKDFTIKFGKESTATQEFRMRPTEACWAGEVSEQEWMDINKGE